MSDNSDPMFDQFKDADFSDAKPVSQVSALARLQAEHGGESRITIRVDNATLAVFKARAEMRGASYQTLIDEALKQFVQGETGADVVRKTIEESLQGGR